MMPATHPLLLAHLDSYLRSAGGKDTHGEGLGREERAAAAEEQAVSAHVLELRKST